ncbi:MAG: competence/damage-inducible protein A [Desulfobacteraceae bacterium]|nr:competence/damage-inducible protein A [Desulfobacteraceae bacterium]
MIVEIVSTGDELISGNIVDTNASYLASKFLEIGMLVKRCNIVGDDKKEIQAVLKEISSRADIVVVTGGLGPTKDDLTAEIAAMVSKDSLIINKEALSAIQSFFEKKNLQMSEVNKKQACLPSKAIMLENDSGTAPGFYMNLGKSIFYFLPGVPFEMKEMFKNKVLPDIFKRFGIKQRLRSKITLFGVPESKAAQNLDGFENKFPNLQLGFRAAFPMIEIKLLSPAITDNVSGKIDLDNARDWILSKFDVAKIVSDKGLSMEEEVARLLIKKKKTIAVAESCTGGLISHLLTDVPGSSAYFLFSAVTYSNEAKINILNVKQDTIVEYGAVHQTTAEEMAKGVMEKAGADFGISTSGIAGPTGGSDEKPVGTICIGFAKKGFSTAKTYCLNFNDRARNKKIFAATCLNLLRKELL